MISDEEFNESEEIQSDDIIIENYFFIDYENVNKDGLNGICGLTENDCVRIYYSDNAQTLSWGLHRRINASKAKFEYVKIDTYGIENAIDIHILIDIKQAYISNKNATFYIISKDHDFDKAVEDYCRKGIDVKKISQICESYNPDSVAADNNVVSKQAGNNSIDKKEQIIRSVFGRCFKESPYKENKEQIIEILLTAKDKQSLNNALTKIIPSSNVPKLREQFKEIISALPSDPSGEKKSDVNLNTVIQQTLSSAGFEQSIVAFTASAACKAKGNKNQIYQALVKNYGNEKGLQIYNHIKKQIK